MVNIDHDDAGAPLLFGTEAGFFGDVFELEVALIEVEFVGAHVGGEEDIGQAIVIDVANGNAGAVIEVPVAEDVEVFVVGYGVLEFNTGVIDFSKKGFCIFIIGTGYQCKNDERM